MDKRRILHILLVLVAECENGAVSGHLLCASLDFEGLAVWHRRQSASFLGHPRRQHAHTHKEPRCVTNWEALLPAAEGQIRFSLKSCAVLRHSCADWGDTTRAGVVALHNRRRAFHVKWPFKKPAPSNQGRGHRVNSRTERRRECAWVCVRFGFCACDKLLTNRLRGWSRRILYRRASPSLTSSPWDRVWWSRVSLFAPGRRPTKKPRGRSPMHFFILYNYRSGVCLFFVFFFRAQSFVANVCERPPPSDSCHHVCALPPLHTSKVWWASS